MFINEDGWLLKPFIFINIYDGHWPVTKAPFGIAADTTRKYVHNSSAKGTITL